MGYELHITRKEHWVDENPELEISLNEWKQYVTNDPSMRLDNYAEATTTGGETLAVYSEGLSVWTLYSRNGFGGGYAWFSYSEGDVVVKGPDNEMRKKMWQIAQVFGAKVQGDDGECYDENGNEIKNETGNDGTETVKKPWWKIW